MHRRGRSSHIVLAVGLAAAAGAGLLWGLAGALGASSSPTPAGAKTVLHVALVNEPDNLNPFVGYSTSSYLIWHLNYDLLTGYHAGNVEPAPELATKWDVSHGGKVWTFTVRDGVRWQDGRPFTARDVAFTYDYVIENEMTAFTNYTRFIKSVVALDDHRVRFTCSKPKANMLGMWIPILPEHVWAKVDPKAAGNSYPNKPPVVGTGPFQVQEWKKGQFMRLEANPDYWRGRPKVDEIVFAFYTNSDTMVQDLKGGTIDAAWGIPDASFDRLQGDPDVKPIAYVVKGYDELGFNCYTRGPSLGNPVLTDAAFRSALNWAIDKQTLVKMIYSGHAYPGTSILPSHYYTQPDYHWEPPPGIAYGYDPQKALQLLSQAGYEQDDQGRLARQAGQADHAAPVRLRRAAARPEDRPAHRGLAAPHRHPSGVPLHV